MAENAYLHAAAAAVKLLFSPSSVPLSSVGIY